MGSQSQHANTPTQTSIHTPTCSQRESLHRSPHPTPLGLTKEDCAVLMEEEEEEEEARSSLGSTASLGDTMYEDDGE